MLKSVMWDVFVTVAIIIAVIFDVSVLRIILLIYTPLIIFAKIVALRSKIVQHRVKKHRTNMAFSCAICPEYPVSGDPTMVDSCWHVAYRMAAFDMVLL